MIRKWWFWLTGLGACLALGMGLRWLQLSQPREKGYVDFREELNLVGKSREEVLELYGEPVAIKDCDDVPLYWQNDTVIQGDTRKACSQTMIYLKEVFKSSIPYDPWTAHYFVVLSEDGTTLAVVKRLK